jgi:SAM-dependent methyltransferase
MTWRIEASEALVGDPCDVTLRSYSAAIDHYIARSNSSSAALHQYLDQFADLIGDGHVLELGSGPGWDADYLEARGVTVSRTDATAEFVERLRSQGHDATVLDVRTDDFGGPYDGVLANAVLLHLNRAQFEDALRRARRAVRPEGVLAVTLKEGDGEAWTTAKLDQPRHFTYWREPKLRTVLERTGWTVISAQHVKGRTEPWLFTLAR